MKGFDFLLKLFSEYFIIIRLPIEQNPMVGTVFFLQKGSCPTPIYLKKNYLEEPFRYHKRAPGPLRHYPLL